MQLPPCNGAKLVLAWPRWREVAAQKIWPVPEAVVTVLCTPDDGCGWHTKHVEWTCRIINRTLCVASRWTIMNMFIKCYIYEGRKKIFKWCTPCSIAETFKVLYYFIAHVSLISAHKESRIFPAPTLNYCINSVQNYAKIYYVDFQAYRNKNLKL